MEKQEYQGYTGVWRRMKSGAAVFIRDGEDIKTAIRRNFNGDKATQKLREYDKKDYEAFEREQHARSELNKALREKGELSSDYEKALKTMKEAKTEQTKIYNEKHDYINEMQDLARKQEQGIKIKQNEFDAIKKSGMTPKQKAQAIDDANGNDWREQIKRNNEETQKITLQLEKDRQNDYYRFRQDEWANKYYGAFRDNERRNAKIKKEIPEEKYEYVDSYATYKDKFDNYKDGETWTGKAYTNDEFMEHLTDANWHTERRILEEANLTNAELSYVKDRVKLGKWSAELDKASTEKLIAEAKTKTNKKLESKTPRARARDIDKKNKK